LLYSHRLFSTPRPSRGFSLYKDNGLPKEILGGRFYTDFISNRIFLNRDNGDIIGVSHA